MYSPAYVVGYGMIDGLGNNPKDCFSNMIIDKDFSHDLPFMLEKNEKHYRGICVDNSSLQLPNISEKILRIMTNSQIFSFHAVEQALKMSGLPFSNDVAVIFSSVATASEGTKEYIDAVHTGKRINPKRVVNRITDMVPASICSFYGFMGASLSLQAACSTGLYTIDYGQKLCEEYDYVIVGCGDANMYFEQLKYFSMLGALGNYNCPFDDKREGFMMGEGAGCLILQSEKKVKEYNSKVYAKLYPAGYASDALDMTSPATDNRGANISISKAIKNSNLNTLDIDVVSAHATSTPIGDPIEYNVIANYFENIPIYAPKSKIGHTLGSAGILETIYAIESMRNKLIPHCQNLNECSFDKLNLLVKSPQKLPNKILRTLNNSFAFGGKCVSQVIEVS
jgi:3-oxoacyl-[acyl-carrier-protein] synthase II